MTIKKDTSRSLTAYERETTVSMSDGDADVRIWTAQRAVITAMRKRPDATEIAAGYYGTTEWAEFRVPKDRFKLALAVRPKRVLSEEQRAALTERLHGSTAARSDKEW